MRLSSARAWLADGRLSKYAAVESHAHTSALLILIILITKQACAGVVVNVNYHILGLHSNAYCYKGFQLRPAGLVVPVQAWYALSISEAPHLNSIQLVAVCRVVAVQNMGMDWKLLKL